MSLGELSAAARRHPRVVDAVIALLLVIACGVIRTGRTGATVTAATWLDWVSIAVVPLPLIWRRSAPVVTFWAVTALLCVAETTGAQSPAAFLVSLAALHAVARYRPARHVWPAIAGTILPGYLNRLDDAHGWIAFVAVSAVTVTTALIGMNQRTRQAYLTALEERASRLERERDQQARLAVAEERARIAREMHDIVAHHLTVMTALAEGAAATVPADPPRAAGVMTQVSATGRLALGEMRRLVGLLRAGTTPTNLNPPDTTPTNPDPPDTTRTSPYPRATASTTGCATPADLGLLVRAGAPDPPFGGGQRLQHCDDLMPQPGFDDIDGLVDRVRAAGLRVAVTRQGAPGPWGPGAGLVVYRIVQESLTNTLKHAGPRARAEVLLRYGTDRAEIDVRDDGAGHPAAVQPGTAGRHGLTGMLERAASYGGGVEAGPREGPGWQVRAHVRFGEP